MSIYYIIMSMIDGFEAFINLAVMVLTIIASWIMYAKAGEPGWAAIVPFYSSYVRFKIAGKKKLFWGYLVATIGIIVGCIILMYEIIASGLSVMTSDYMGSYYDSTYGYAGSRIGAHMGMLIFAVILIIAAMIVALVMSILCCVGLSHAFGKGAGFACGLIFLNVIFVCIIAFNKKIVYVGNGYSNNNYYNPYGSNGYGQQYGQNMYGNGTNQQYGQNMYGNGANQQYGQNMYGNGANQQYGQNMYGNGANQQYGQNMYGNGAAQGGDAQNSYGTSQQQSWNDEYNNKDYE
uniref:DUF5684 domain-containing protein n=1 Tax=Agathobacter rectalis TaxID=39491 RepID=UPI003FF04037